MFRGMTWNQKFFRRYIQECRFINSLFFHLFENTEWVLMNTKHCSRHKFILKHFPTEYQQKKNEDRGAGYISWLMDFFFNFYIYYEQKISSVQCKVKSLGQESEHSFTSWPHHLLALQPGISHIISHHYRSMTRFG